MNSPGPDRHQLARSFRKQETFSRDYSPLYGHFFGAVAGWLEQEPPHPLADWLVATSHGRAPFEVTLLLAAAVHRDILAAEPELLELARFYPAVGGTTPSHRDAFARSLHTAVWARRAQYVPFIQSATVQTNETGRGLAWLLPLLAPRRHGVHLVDLGASAGLNLLADFRAFRLINEDGRLLADIGSGTPVQFQTICQDSHYLPQTAVRQAKLPAILSRTGCDIAPFRLETALDELTLTAFVWGDQPARLNRLHEGFAAWRQAVGSGTAVCLHQAALPQDLTSFLEHHIPTDPAGMVVIYNTYMTVYLENRGRSMHPLIAEWAVTQARPVVWLQWEPAWDGPQPPAPGWVAWTVTCWHAGKTKQFQIAWAHPHGGQLAWLPDCGRWFDFAVRWL